jgi:hypothetical protein
LDKDCFDTDLQVVLITGPGCVTFPVTDNDFGALPTAFGPDVDIDPFDFDSRFNFLEDIDFDTVDKNFVDLWRRLPNALQTDVYTLDCYCPGDGIDRPSLTVGPPKFPSVVPLPFFWIPPIVPFGFDVREINPDGPKTPYNCCPGEGGGFDAEGNPVPFKEFIKAEFKGNELQLTRTAQEDPEHVYRSYFMGKDISPAYLAQAGFPRYCCVRDICDENGELIEEGPSASLGKYNQHWLHYPNWLNDIRNPYDEDDPQEPVGIIPFVTMGRCDPDGGQLILYNHALIIYDGRIHDIQWNIEPPINADNPNPTDPPTHPEDLPYNRDYFDQPLIPLPGDPDLPIPEEFVEFESDPCLNQCSIVPEGCDPSCDDDICPEGFEFESEHSATGATKLDAVFNATIDAAIIGFTSCEDTFDVLPCYSFQTIDGGWEAHVAICCRIVE